MFSLSGRQTRDYESRYDSIYGFTVNLILSIEMSKVSRQANTCAWERALELFFHQDQQYLEGNYLPGVIRRQWESLSRSRSGASGDSARWRKGIVHPYVCRCRNRVAMLRRFDNVRGSIRFIRSLANRKCFVYLRVEMRSHDCYKEEKLFGDYLDPS